MLEIYMKFRSIRLAVDRKKEYGIKDGIGVVLGGGKERWGDRRDPPMILYDGHFDLSLRIEY